MNRTAVSARHACLRKKEGVWEIWQEGVTNPTYVNGKELSLVNILKDGDVFAISKRSFRVNYKDEDPFLESVDLLRKQVQYFQPFCLSDYGMMCWKCDNIMNVLNIQEYGCCPYCESKNETTMLRDERVQKMVRKDGIQWQTGRRRRRPNRSSTARGGKRHFSRS